MVSHSQATEAFIAALGLPKWRSNLLAVWKLDHREVRLEITMRGTVADMTDRSERGYDKWKRREIVLSDQAALTVAIGTAECCLVDGL